MPAERPALEQHAADARQVGGGREHAGVAGDAAEQARARVVDLALQEMAVGVLRRRDPVADRRGRVEARGAQAERVEEHARQVAIERLAAHAADDLGEEDEARVAVLERRARRVVERDPGERPGGAREAAGDGAVRRVGREAGGVRQDPPDRDLRVGRAAELFEVPAQRRVELDRAALHEREDGQRRTDGLRERGNVEDRVARHRGRLGHEAPEAPRAVQEDVVAAPDEHDHTRDLAGDDGLGGRLVDGREVEGLRSDGGGHGEHDERRRAQDAS